MTLTQADSELLDRAARLVAESQSVLFVTGAGMSAESGLPTYRGVAGLYNSGVADEGMPIEEILSGYTFRDRPELTWKYLLEVERACRGATFHRGHAVLAQIEATVPRVCVLTQNVDGFHIAAGSRNVIEIHGNLHRLLCTACSYRATIDDYAGLSLPPLCPDCGELIRPAVVLFGEMLPPDDVSRMDEELRRGFDLVVSIGTSSLFPYISGPVEAARRKRIPTIEINPGTSDVSHLVDIRIQLPAARALDVIWERFLAWRDAGFGGQPTR